MKKKTNAWEGIALLVVIAVPSIAIGWYFFGQNTSDAAPETTQPIQQQTAPQQASSVTLSLNDQGALPQSVTTGQIVPFSFTIENPESFPTTYQYKVSVLWNDGEEDVIDENIVSLPAGSSTPIAEGLKFEEASDTAQVTIEIEQPEKEITFSLPSSQ